MRDRETLPVLGRVREWRAGRWNRRLDATLANTPTWRLMQELHHRQALRDAPSSEAGFTKGESFGRREGIAVDSFGVPLLQQMHDGVPLGSDENRPVG